MYLNSRLIQQIRTTVVSLVPTDSILSQDMETTEAAIVWNSFLVMETKETCMPVPYIYGIIINEQTVHHAESSI